MSETRYLYDENNQVKGEITMPDGTTEDQWFKVLHAYDTPAPVVPQQVMVWRLKGILKLMGLDDEIDSAIASLDEPNKTLAGLAWNMGTTADRNSPLVTLLAQVAQLSDAQVDEIFTQAYNIDA